MIKPRYFLLIIILNIGLLIGYTINSEYKHIADTVNRFDLKMQSIIDSSIDESMASEELFTEMSSGFLASDTNRYGKLPVYDEVGNRTMLNMYAVAMFHDTYSRLPKSAGELIYPSDSMSFFKTAYRWAFGDVDTRVPSDDFKRYFDVVGNKITVDAAVPVNDSINGYRLETHSIPVLAQTGLALSDYNTDARYEAETLTRVEKEGYDNTKYYLTPYSLGVTYVNKRLLKTCIMTNIEDAFRLSHASGLSDANKKKAAYGNASGCIKSKIGSSTGGKEEHKGYSALNQSYKAVDSSGNAYQSGVLNDGMVEIDMNSLDVDVDYSVVNFYDNKNSELVTFIEGYAGTPAERKRYPHDILSVRNKSLNGYRIVARITVSFNINIPYSSEFSQYCKKLTSSGTVEHYGINGFTYNSVTKDSTGYAKDGGNVRYEYTAYKALSR